MLLSLTSLHAVDPYDRWRLTGLLVGGCCVVGCVWLGDLFLAFCVLFCFVCRVGLVVCCWFFFCFVCGSGGCLFIFFLVDVFFICLFFICLIIRYLSIILFLFIYLVISMSVDL